MKRLGLYLHVPFCRSKCLYCDFCSFPRPDGETVERYVTALCADLSAWSARACDRVVDTVYFGGGTPTLLHAEQLERILACVYEHYSVDKEAEISAECNPATAGSETFVSMRRAGFNRLSIGVQSIHRNELRALGRTHSFDDVCRTWQQATDAGFDNISADLMSGIPQQTLASWSETVGAVCALSPTHVSAYGLIVEEGTPFARREDKLPLPDEEAAREMYFSGIEQLAAHGLVQYEISNFSKPGYESRHNLKYWNCDEYLGFGPAAYSDFDGVRFGNSRDLFAYTDGREILAEREAPTLSARINEYVMLRMRLCEGVERDAFSARFGASLDALFGNAFCRFVPGGLVKKTERGFSFSREGMYVSNALLSEILDFSSDFSSKIEKTS